MKYCTYCVMPDTKPNLPFDSDGVCDACRNFQRKDGDHSQSIDWELREQEFKSIIEEHR